VRDSRRSGYENCFACHEKAKVSDLVFTHYAPEAQNVYLADAPDGRRWNPTSSPLERCRCSGHGSLVTRRQMDCRRRKRPRGSELVQVTGRRRSAGSDRKRTVPRSRVVAARRPDCVLRYRCSLERRFWRYTRMALL
jgi:hypothetical protein